MPAVKYDIVVEQGASFRLAMLWVAPPNDTPVDVTGFTAASQIRASHGDATVLLAFSSDLGANPLTRIVLDGPTGAITLEADPDATRPLTFHQGVYDVEVTSPDGAVYRLVEGRVRLSREVTE